MRDWLRGRRGVHLVIASLALLGLTIGTFLVRAGDDPSPSAQPTTTITTAAASRDDATSTPIVTISTAALDMPTDPSGARTDQSELGARRSALDYATTVRQRIVYLTADAGGEVLTDWAASGVDPSVIASDVTGAAATRDALSANGGQVWWSVAPLGIQVEAYTPGRAEVSVWTVTVGAGGADTDHDQAVVPIAHYQTVTVDLQWDGSRWTVWSTSTTDGPAPMLAPSQTPADPAEFLTALGTFELIKEHN